MTQNPEPGTSRVARLAAQARTAALQLATLPDEIRRQALLAAAACLERRRDEIVAANTADCEAARSLVEQGKMSPALFNRLQTSERGVMEMAALVRSVADLPDPLGRELSVTELDEGLILSRVTCPLGVVAIIFESRPDAVPQVAALALRSGNALLLKGGSEAQRSNAVLTEIWRDAIGGFPGIPADAVIALQTREQIGELLALDQSIDLIIPRGSQEFVNYIMRHSRIPVLGHGSGICHVYIDRRADVEKAIAVAFDSKVQYPAVCNAMETLLVHAEIAPRFLPGMLKKFSEAGVQLRGCSRTRALAGIVPMQPATEADWETEYSDLILSIRIVDDLEDAIAHINRWGSKHTASIVTEDADAAAAFLDRVDAASVCHNVSTRFADGFRYGLGAELGIATGKLHARGPVGVEGLTTYKYKLTGNGHTVATYACGEKRFTHRKLK